MTASGEVEKAKRAVLVIAAGDNSMLALNRVLDHHKWFESTSVTLAIADRRLLEVPAAHGRLVAEALTQRGLDHTVLSPSGTTLLGAWFSTRKTDWRPLKLPKTADRLELVWLPAVLTAGTSIVAVNTLPARTATRDPIAIGIWSKFAHPRQRTGAWMSNVRDGLTAEVALAVKPALILLLTKWRGHTLIVASDDQIAAELAGLAIQQLTAEHAPDAIGPWEHPLVQHATELKLGIDHPGQIVADAFWAGEHADATGYAFAEFATGVLARIGVKSTS